MTEKDFSYLNDEQFEDLLENLEISPPDEELLHQVNPWRKAMNRILWGMGLCTITLNFFRLDYILPAIGIVASLLGYRALRSENRWFRGAYYLTLIRAVWFLVGLFVDTTVFAREFAASGLAAALTWLGVAVNFLCLVCLRNGMKAVQRKAGLEPQVGSATALVVWYVVMTILAVLAFTGWAVLFLLVSYCFILRGLYRCSKLLDEAGYLIQPESVKLSDRAVKIGFAAIVAMLFVIGYTCFDQYPMAWRGEESIHTEKVGEIRNALLSLGFPEAVLNDLTEEEILALEGATCVMVDEEYAAMNNGRKVTTRSPGLIHTTTVYDMKELRIWEIGVKLPGDRDHWKIIQHFEWVAAPEMFGTESIMIWDLNARSSFGWRSEDNYAGRVLYDLDGITYTAPYYSLGRESYQSDSLLASMFGQSDYSGIFANFSFPEKGTRQRCYISYDIWETRDGCIVDCWWEYTHQTGRIQFPVRTAMEDNMAGFGGWDSSFVTRQGALQFSTHDEEPKLLK